ncbi:MAG: SAM-dependent chlorinase/fluorinase, partial [Chitinophagaceae bacterium]|nr:SAM-dependent chlorinase/fluorinase [Chitinophagaceae bacterium]
HVDPGEKLAWFNSAGYLEIAVNKGNMAGLFGLQNYSDATSQNTLQNTLFYKLFLLHIRHAFRENIFAPAFDYFFFCS